MSDQQPPCCWKVVQSSDLLKACRFRRRGETYITVVSSWLQSNPGTWAHVTTMQLSLFHPHLLLRLGVQVSACSPCFIVLHFNVLHSYSIFFFFFFFFLQIEGLWLPCVIRWWLAFFRSIFKLRCVHFFRHNAIAHLIDYSIVYYSIVTFVSTGKPKNLCDSLYCIICFVVVVWNWTHRVSGVCLHWGLLS